MARSTATRLSSAALALLAGLVAATRYDDGAGRERFAKAWDATLPTKGGANLLEILKRCKSGHIKARYVLGENPLATLPASMEVRSALEKLELLVVQEPFLTDTGRLAHFVLPACTYAEKDGTFTNLEGRVLRVRQAMEPIGESLPTRLAYHDRAGQCLGRPMAL